MPDPTAPEPTMEEILASIRRIITEEDPPVDTGGAHTAATAVVEAEPPATEPLASESVAAKAETPAPWNGEMPVSDPAPEATPPVSAPEPAAPATIVYTPAPTEPSIFAKPVMAPEPLAPETPATPSVAAAAIDATSTADLAAPLVGAQASAETASAFDRLTAAVKVAPKESSIMLPAPGRSLEDLTRELLRPLLQEWLDENLPEIVRQQVDEEVARIARGRSS